MNKLFIYLILLCITYSCKKSGVSSADCFYPIKAKDKYVYPHELSQGPARLPSGGYERHEFIMKCQLPDFVLKTISTLGLIQSLESNPVVIDFWFFSSSSLSITDEQKLKKVNAYTELLMRADVGPVLLNYYNLKDLNCIGNIKTLGERVNFGANINNINVILSQDSVLSTLSISDKKILARIALEKRKQLNKNLEYYNFATIANLKLLSNIMINAKFKIYLEAMQTDKNLMDYVDNNSLSELAEKQVEIYANLFITS